MESRTSGGIDRHLAALRRAVTDWLTYEYPPEDEAGRDDVLLRLSTEEHYTIPDVPEILSLVRESRAYSVPIFNGSLMDMPYFFHLELNTCVDAEREFFNLREFNRRLREQWGNAKDKSQSVH